jgi:predicted transcriptional regulator
MGTRERVSNRTREQIIAEMLAGLQSPVRRTEVMYSARLSYTQLKFYHAILLSRGLVAKVAASAEGDGRYSGLWVATEKGRQYLQAYATIKAMAC